MAGKKYTGRSTGEIKADRTRRRKRALTSNPQAVFRRFVRMLEKLQAGAPDADKAIFDRRDQTT